MFYFCCDCYSGQRDRDPILIEGDCHDRDYAFRPAEPLLISSTNGKSGSENALWAYQISKTDLGQFAVNYPLTRDELAALLRARKISRDELAQSGQSTVTA
jgi:hypothetical protein